MGVIKESDSWEEIELWLNHDICYCNGREKERATQVVRARGG